MNAKITPADGATALRARHIRRADFNPCASAFIDVRIPGSEGKLNYSFIGPGVTQSDEQPVNFNEPHEFQIGGVQLPRGHINNLHLHFTAEVFICARGEWRCFWGVDGGDGEVVLRAGDVISVPTWVFRGFQNLGDDDGFMFSALGGDDTGGILWSPTVLARAAETGLYLTRDNLVVDAGPGRPPPVGTALLEPLAGDDLALLGTLSAQQMRAEQVSAAADRRWSTRPFLVSALDDRPIELAAVLGVGLSQDRTVGAPIRGAHGFSIDRLRGDAGAGLPPYRLTSKQVLINLGGRWRLTLDAADGPVEIELGEWDIYSVPAGVWREIAALDDEGELLSVCAGDARPKISWRPQQIERALAAGWALDAGGFVAPARLLP